MCLRRKNWSNESPNHLFKRSAICVFVLVFVASGCSISRFLWPSRGAKRCDNTTEHVTADTSIVKWELFNIAGPKSESVDCCSQLCSNVKTEAHELAMFRLMKHGFQLVNLKWKSVWKELWWAQWVIYLILCRTLGTLAIQFCILIQRGWKEHAYLCC